MNNPAERVKHYLTDRDFKKEAFEVFRSFMHFFPLNLIMQCNIQQTEAWRRNIP